MNRNLLDRERTSREIILFAAVSLGVLLSAFGIILSSVPIALTGLGVSGLGFAGFALQKT